MYEVKLNGVTKMSTESLSCLYTKKIRDQMRACGYIIYKDGKVFEK